MTQRLLVISAEVTVRWVDGLLTVAPERGQGIETRDPTMLWLLNEFATPKYPALVATSLPSTPAAALETAIADLQSTGILVPAPAQAAPPEQAGPTAGATQREPSERPQVTLGERPPVLSASVILPTSNNARLLDYTLASYAGQSDEHFELVIVDDGGGEATRRVVDHYESRLYVQYLRTDRLGRAAARNAGIARASGDILIFSDDDRVVAPAFVQTHCDAYRSPSEPRLVLGWSHGVLTLLDEGLMGATFPVLSPKLRSAADRSAGPVSLFEPADLEEHFADTIAEFSTADPEFKRRVLPALDEYGDDLTELALPWYLGLAGNFSAPRQLVAEVGMFDERYEDHRLEDVDFCYGLARAGARARLARGAESYHQLHEEPERGVGERRSLRYFARKHDRLEARLFLWWWTGGVELRLANQIALAAKSGRATADPVLAALNHAMAELLHGKLHG